MVYKFFDKRSSAGGIKSQNISNKELAEEILKPVIRTFEKRKVHSPFIGNILGAVKQLISKFNEEFKFFLSVIDIYTKYAWVVPLKDKKLIIISNAFQKVLKKSNCNPNKIWVTKAANLVNRSIKSLLEKNNIEMYSTHNEGKSVFVEMFIRTLIL